MRHQKPMGFIGVWPEFTMLNHSCAPNVSVTVVGDRMLLHASADVPAGGELTTNYIGRYVAAPLAVRRARLQEDCGFRCAAPCDDLLCCHFGFASDCNGCEVEGSCSTCKCALPAQQEAERC